MSKTSSNSFNRVIDQTEWSDFRSKKRERLI